MSLFREKKESERKEETRIWCVLALHVILCHHVAEIRLCLSSGENITSSNKGNSAYLFY